MIFKERGGAGTSNLYASLDSFPSTVGWQGLEIKDFWIRFCMVFTTCASRCKQMMPSSTDQTSAASFRTLLEIREEDVMMCLACVRHVSGGQAASPSGNQDSMTCEIWRKVAVYLQEWINDSTLHRTFLSICEYVYVPRVVLTITVTQVLLDLNYHVLVEQRRTFALLITHSWCKCSKISWYFYIWLKYCLHLKGPLFFLLLCFFLAPKDEHRTSQRSGWHISPELI